MGQVSTRVRLWLNGRRFRLAESRGQRWWSLIRPLSAGVATCVVLSLLFVLLADEVVADRRERLDRQLSRWVRDHGSPGLTRVMQVVTDLASTPVVVPLWLLMVGWLVRRRRRRAAILLAVAWPLGQGLVAMIKVAVHRERPQLDPGIAPFGGYSFPSGHTFTAVATYGLIAALIAGRLSGWARWIPWVAAALITAGVGFSRVYLGAHFPVDVLGSLLLGGTWLCATLIALSLTTPTASRGGIGCEHRVKASNHTGCAVEDNECPSRPPF